MWYWLLLLTGFGLAVAGGTVTITYLNLVPAGLSWIEFIILLKSRVECYLFPIGMVLIVVALILMDD
ncbi:hypothetical protein SAMN05192559_106184 [Halobacillus karajensis]|uniref:Uncharacterized protein n=1 Tax=Halobacillus karajensis TaxID=195088 RepID=A0A024P700_9BACI|nr:hypothetical protein [Halobacillus karajensis]CDQ21032.1 hypothetical protein BN982_03395 [Halobacillus karajensis]CDQ24904.1 hypothetical protein BN983_03203 [Halobacillus karajensis]CDQ28736.1 hypothetical protein BN981_03051 [Halobacillus karajensis]SEH97202.1 hypothetical protein SAMN05192559_106184 [Halobacillus karajensis]